MRLGKAARMNRRSFAIVWATLTFWLAGSGSLAAQAPESPVKVAAEKAIDHVGETVQIEMTVQSGKKADSSERYYLDSEKDYKSSTNVAVVIPFETAAAFEKEGVKDILAHFLDKKVRVTGKVVRSADQTRIFVTDPKKIELIAAPAK